MATEPNVSNYQVPKGELYFDRWDANGNATGERDLGNAPAFSVVPSIETLEHFTSRRGIKSKDKEIDVSQSGQLKFSLDEVTPDNLAIALYGDGVEVASQGDGNVGGEAITARQDRWVKLENRNISVSSVGIAGYTEDTDFTVDTVTGRIMALSTGGIADGEALLVSYTFGAMTWNTVEIFGRKPVEGLMRYVGTNDEGIKYEVVLWHVKFKMSTDWNLIGEDWSMLEFEGEILDDTSNNPNNPFGLVYEEGVDISGS